MVLHRGFFGILFFTLLSFAVIPSSAAALEQTECGGLFIVFPKGEEEIALRLKENIPGILAFLEKQGLPVTLPVHVVLDGNLDQPDAVSSMIPHREVRIPLRAPGVLEEGYLEEDPWLYFTFKGLCLQGIYSLRQGVPALAHHLFGEVVSPNAILPPWITDGVCTVLYSSWKGTAVEDPYARVLFGTTLPGDLSRVSNHPGTWPGYYAYRIYGIPFMSWVQGRYGWERIRDFLLIHGGGIVPIEIDLKARKAFGRSWSDLWADFLKENPSRSLDAPGMLIEGFWPDPFTSWNTAGVHPGRKSIELRSRYGFLEPGGTLWVSEYRNQGISQVVGYRNGVVMEPGQAHIWDPSAGSVAVTRQGSRPCLAFFAVKENQALATISITQTVPAPPGVIQLSGPVLNGRGEIAVSANTGGNWDIWIYDGRWQKVTAHPGIDMDPWWMGEDLFFSSNMTGTFQIHGRDLSQQTQAERGAVLPRGGSYLSLTPAGWKVEPFMPLPAPALEARGPGEELAGEGLRETVLDAGAYSPRHSITPNFIAPDAYVGPSDVQAGLVSWSRDVSGKYALRAGVRYSFNLDYYSFQLSSQIRDVGLSYARYPFSYDPENAPETEESRTEMGVSLSPLGLRWLSLSLSRLSFEPLEDPGPWDHETWGSASFAGRLGPFTPGLTLESYSGGRKSAFGSLRCVFGTDTVFESYIQAGRTWGDIQPGHGTFRVGGDVGEGYFTKRPSRLFPLRGFGPNILEARQALTASAEVYHPLADLQKGHKTLPLFLHRLSLGTFIDAGFCSDKITRDQLIAGAGFELLTSMEVAWGNFSVFKIGVAWPVAQPDILNERGPVLVLQVGRPL